MTKRQTVIGKLMGKNIHRRPDVVLILFKSKYHFTLQCTPPISLPSSGTSPAVPGPSPESRAGPLFPLLHLKIGGPILNTHFKKTNQNRVISGVSVNVLALGL